MILSRNTGWHYTEKEFRRDDMFPLAADLKKLFTPGDGCKLVLSPKPGEATGDENDITRVSTTIINVIKLSIFNDKDGNIPIL